MGEEARARERFRSIKEQLRTTNYDTNIRVEGGGERSSEMPATPRDWVAS